MRHTQSAHTTSDSLQRSHVTNLYALMRALLSIALTSQLTLAQPSPLAPPTSSQPTSPQPTSLERQPPQALTFARAERVSLLNMPDKVAFLLSFQGDPSWDQARASWRYPISPSDERLWGGARQEHEGEALFEERRARLRSIDMEELDEPQRALFAELKQRLSSTEKMRGAELNKAIKNLYPSALPSRLITSEQHYLYSYNQQVPNIWVFWSPKPLYELSRDACALVINEVISEVPDQKRPTDKFLFIEGSRAIERETDLTSKAEQQKHLHDQGLPLCQRPSSVSAHTSHPDIATGERLSQVMISLMHKYEGDQGKNVFCGRDPCAHLIPHVHLVILSETLKLTSKLEEIALRLSTPTNIFYGATISQLSLKGLSLKGLSLKGLSAPHPDLVNLQARSPSPIKPSLTLSPLSLASYFQSINEAMSRHFVMIPPVQLDPYYWGADHALTLEVTKENRERLSLEVPFFVDRKTLTPAQLERDRRAQQELTLARGLELHSRPSRDLLRSLLVIGVLLSLGALAWLTRRRQLLSGAHPIEPPHVSAERPSPINTSERPRGDLIAHVYPAPVNSPAEAPSPELPSSSSLDWATNAQEPPRGTVLPPRLSHPPHEPQDEHNQRGVAGTFIPTTSERNQGTSESIEEPHAPSVPSQSAAERAPVVITPQRSQEPQPHDPSLEELGLSREPPPSSAPPQSPWFDSQQPRQRSAHSQELNTAPYGAQLTLAVGELALCAERGTLKGDIYLVTLSPSLVGRGESAECQLPPVGDLTISRRHCVLKRKSSKAWEVKCLSSAGMYVNKSLLQEGETQTLYDKDTLTMGRSRFRVRLGPISPAQP